VVVRNSCKGKLQDVLVSKTTNYCLSWDGVTLSKKTGKWRFKYYQTVILVCTEVR
jgi:hypothetical protein